MNRKLTWSFIITLIVVCSMAIGALGATGFQKIEAYLNHDLKIELKGEAWTPEQTPITYEGYTYLPVRAVGEALDVHIGYDNATKTVFIGESDSKEEPKENTKEITATVTNVVDGDTIDVTDENGTERRVRMIGVDTPETVHPELGEQPFGREASNYTKERLTGKTVKLELDVQEIDQYGRTLAYVWIGDEHFNAMLLKEGYAVLSTWPPNVKYVDDFVIYQKEAREAKKGLWGVEEIASQYVVGRYEIDPDTGLPLSKVNINTATLEELQLIPNVGEVIAQRIIDYRNNGNTFSTPEGLINISGIGATTLERMLPYVTVE